MTKRTLGAVIAAVLVLSMLMAGCAGPAKSGKDTVTFVIWNEIMSLDQGATSSDTDYIMYSTCLYEGLCTLKGDGSVVPCLAEKWEIQDDGLKYVFHLKKGVKFHNGEELKASDVVFSYLRAKESPFTESFGSLFTDVKAVDESTVEVTLAAPFAPFLRNVAGQMIHNEKAVKDAGEKYGQNPIGTGPYKFVSYDLGQKVTFTRFDDYHGGKAPITNVVYKIITDPNTALVSLESGDADYLFKIPEIAYENVKKNNKLQVSEFESRELTHLTMNITKPPFDNVKVRQAMNMAVDKEALVKMALEGLGKPAKYVLNNKYFGYSDKVTGYSFDVEKAKQLLSEAGYPDGFEVKLQTCDNYKKSAEVVQEQLGKIGIKASMEMTDQNAMMEAVASGNYNLALFMWSLDSDADTWKYMFKTGEMVNYAPYSNSTVDELFTKAGAAVTDAERVQAYEQLFQIISDDAVMVPLFHATLISAADAKLKIGEKDPFGYALPFYMSWQ